MVGPSRLARLEPERLVLQRLHARWEYMIARVEVDQQPLLSPRSVLDHSNRPSVTSEMPQFNVNAATSWPTGWFPAR